MIVLYVTILNSFFLKNNRTNQGEGYLQRWKKKNGLTFFETGNSA